MARLARRARLGFLALALITMLATPAGVFADDGEIGDMGDTDSITDVFDSGLYPAVNIDYLRDCAAGGVTDCWVEVQFVSRCPEFWCGWDAQSWKRIPASGAARGNCLGAGNEDNEWYVNYRVAYTASTTITVRWKGEVELVYTISGGGVYRMLVEAMFNVTGNLGYRYGYTVETVTAKSDYGPVVQAATSLGRDLHTC